MGQIREIGKRIKAVRNIERITGTMQMIATAKFQAAVKRAQATKPYTDKLAEIVGELAGATGEDGGHPLLSAPAQPTGRSLLLVISSNRGLCGAYNASLLRTAANFLKERSDENVEVEVVGKKGIGFFKFADQEVSRAYTEFDDKITYEQVESVAASYIDRFAAGEFDAVHIAYTQFVSNARQDPQVVQLLPLEQPEAAEGEDTANVVYEFSPDPAELLGHLLPLTVKSRLFQFFNDATVSEQISRMVAMKAATDNAGKMGHSLKREFNRARQTQITTELSEIISGAAALE